jgi:glycosyltransferase involved in cell wall biosynthesis
MKKRIRKDNQERVAAGFRKMSTLRVGICAMARDCGPRLQRIIPELEQIRKACKESHVVVVENDSIDNTKQVLRDWQSASKNVCILSEDTNSETILSQKDDISNPFFSLNRIGKMAAYRNKYLEYFEELNLDLDYLIIVDVDLQKIKLEGIAHSFGQPIDWDMISANGLFPRKKLKQFYKGYLYYDGYALRAFGEQREQNQETAFYNQYQYSGLKPGMPLIHVASAFNGLAMYKWEAIRSLRYHCEPNDDSEIKAKCEHINLHRQMAERGHDKIYINPAQIVYYDRYSDMLKKSLTGQRKSGSKP